MSGSWFLGGESRRPHKLVTPGEVHLFAKLGQYPGLHLLTTPHHPLNEVLVETSCKGLLLVCGQHPGPPPILSASILQARQSERVVPPDHQSCGAHAEFGDPHHFIFATSFCAECEELRASALNRTDASFVDGPEVVRLMLEPDWTVELCHSHIL